ncbi:hypothetical protein [Gulosibacter hominis]|uniref:hypothetical protein n=1 Tax=Gulosibacter hominis TaxID=2770504 RepID=UPI00191A5B3A|nr:hypothetical protein [Gulosibacter hominis]
MRFEIYDDEPLMVAAANEARAAHRSMPTAEKSAANREKLEAVERQFPASYLATRTPKHSDDPFHNPPNEYLFTCSLGDLVALIRLAGDHDRLLQADIEDGMDDEYRTLARARHRLTCLYDEAFDILETRAFEVNRDFTEG